MADINFQIVLENFNEGNAPTAHLDDKTFIGNKGQAADMQADVISRPGYLTQGPGLVNLINGSEVGSLTELIRFILDKPTDVDTTFGVGLSKLYKISSTTLIDDATWPQTISSMISGESVIRLNANLFIFYNTLTAGDIAAMPLATEVIDPTWGSITVSGGTALQNSLHPSATKEDILLFGNGRYIGVYIEGLGTLNTQKLDFGAGAEVADIVFSANLWWIAVNYGIGARKTSEVFMYDGSAISTVLSDEAGVGLQRIGFLYVLNGLVYICYEDMSSESLILGFFSGRQIKPLRYFKGVLPDHRQKTLYRNTILFVSDQTIWSMGAVVDQLPLQISQLSTGGLSIVGGIAAPFGIPMIASVDNSGHARLVQFSGYAQDSYFKGIFVPVFSGLNLGKIVTIIVITRPLAIDSRCDITLEGDQGQVVSTIAQEVSGENKTRHVFKTIGMQGVQDVRAVVSYANGSIVNDCPIRMIILLGNYVER